MLMSSTPVRNRKPPCCGDGAAALAATRPTAPSSAIPMAHGGPPGLRRRGWRFMTRLLLGLFRRAAGGEPRRRWTGGVAPCPARRAAIDVADGLPVRRAEADTLAPDCRRPGHQDPERRLAPRRQLREIEQGRAARQERAAAVEEKRHRADVAAVTPTARVLHDAGDHEGVAVAIVV